MWVLIFFRFRPYQKLLFLLMTILIYRTRLKYDFSYKVTVQMAQIVYIYIFQSAKNQCSVVAIFDVRKEWTLFREKHQKFLKIFVLLWQIFLWRKTETWNVHGLTVRYQVMIKACMTFVQVNLKTTSNEYSLMYSK